MTGERVRSRRTGVGQGEGAQNLARHHRNAWADRDGSIGYCTWRSHGLKPDPLRGRSEALRQRRVSTRRAVLSDFAGARPSVSPG